MVDLQEHLHSVNERIMSGLAVSEEEWTKLRKVRFEWEPRATNDPGSASLVEMDLQWTKTRTWNRACCRVPSSSEE
jgi:hypothetical protein